MTASVRQSLFEDTLHSLGTKAISIPLSFFIGVILARSLGPEGKGGYDLFVATGELLMMVLGFSLPSGIVYVTALSAVSPRAMARWLTPVAVGQGLLAIFLLGIARHAGFVWTFLPRDCGGSIIFLSTAYVCLNTLVGYWRAILIGRREIIPTNRITLLTRLADVGLLLLLLGMSRLIGRPLDLYLVIWLLLVSSLISNVLFLSRLRVPLASSRGTSGFRQVVAYSAPCYLGNLVQFLNYRLDTFLVSFIVGQSAVGLYALAVSLAQMLWLLPNAAATALLPRVAGQQELVAHNAHITAQATRFSFWLSLMAGIALSLLSVVALPLVYGKAFRDSIAPLLWLMPGVVAIGPAFVLAAYVGGIGKPHLNMYISTAGLFLTVLLDLLLIPRLSIVGAAIASTASYSLITVLTVILFRRETGLGLAVLLSPTRDDAALVIKLAQRINGKVRGSHLS